MKSTVFTILTVLVIFIFSCSKTQKVVSKSLPKEFIGIWSPGGRSSGKEFLEVRSNSLIYNLSHHQIAFQIISESEDWPFSRDYFKNDFSKTELLSKQFLLKPNDISDKNLYAIFLSGHYTEFYKEKGRVRAVELGNEFIHLTLAFAEFDFALEYSSALCRAMFKKDWGTMGWSRVINPNKL